MTPTGSLKNIPPATPDPAQTPVTPEAVPLVDPRTGEPILDPETGAQLMGIPAPQPVPMIDPVTREPLLDPETGETLLAMPDPSATPTPAATEGVKGADAVREAVTEQSETVGSFVDTLDSLAIQLGDFRVSVWDGMVVLMVIVGVISLAWFLSRLAHSAVRRMTKLGDTQQLLTEKVVTILVWIAAFFIGISLLGIDLTALAIFSGAFAFAIGFGLQKTFGNLIAGIILLMDRSIKPGDVIAVADQAGVSTFGQIRKIGIRAVSITTRDQKEYLIPNENLMINQVENWSYSSKQVRMQIPVGISYGCDIKVGERLMLEAAVSCKRVLKSPPPTVWLDQYGDSSVDFVIHCWITDPEAGIGNVKSEVLKNLWELFKSEGIEIPFPQRDINLRNNTQFEQLIAAVGQRLDDRKPEKK